MQYQKKQKHYQLLRFFFYYYYYYPVYIARLNSNKAFFFPSIVWAVSSLLLTLYAIIPAFSPHKFICSILQNFFHLCFWLSKTNYFASVILFCGYAIIKIEE